MVSERYEIRLDSERRKKLDQLVSEHRAPAAEVMRRALDSLYEEWLQKRRHEAAQRLIAMELPDDVPEPQELSRQLDEAHDPGIH
jgi:predicted transcriptional regulator